MPEFEDILRDKGVTEATSDDNWMNEYTLVLMNLSDEYLVEALRLTLMVCAFRLVGDDEQNPSYELSKHGLNQVIKLVQEGIAD